jgi:hypothetical protein
LIPHLLLSLVASWLLLSAEVRSDSPPRSGASAASIPFELHDHVVVVEGKINGHPEDFRFVVDTGGRTFLDPDVVTRLGLKRRGPMAKMETLELSGLRIDGVFALLLFDFGRFERGMGLHLDGMIGSDLLERFHVTLDYEAKRLTLASERPRTATEAKGYRLPFTNHPVNNAPIVPFTIDGEVEVRAMIDTGQPYPIVFPIAQLEKIAAAGDRPPIRSKGPVWKWPNTSSDVNHLGRIGDGRIGGFETGPMLALFAELPAPLSMPLLGTDFLSRFRITIHYPDDEIVLVPREGVKIPTNDLSFGFRAERDEDGALRVTGVWEGSPADLAGIARGDEILRVDSEDVAPGTVAKLNRLLVDDEAREIRLELRGGEANREIRLEKRWLLPPLGE